MTWAEILGVVADVFGVVEALASVASLAVGYQIGLWHGRMVK